MQVAIDTTAVGKVQKKGDPNALKVEDVIKCPLKRFHLAFVYASGFAS